jgi:uncharacterized protein DUF6884
MCSGEKSATSALAQDFYESSRFRNDRDIAEREYGEWRILSGRYGLVSPKKCLAPYDFDLDVSGPIRRAWWVVCVTLQLFRVVGWRTPAIIGLRARGFYLEGALKALQFLGFRENARKHLDFYGSVLRFRGDVNGNTDF